MPKTTHIVTDSLQKPLAVFADGAEARDYAIRQAVATGRSVNVHDVATLDVATVARIATADCPRLAQAGTGVLGAGTHPAAPYLEAMRAMGGIGPVANLRTVQFGYDTAHDVVLRFLENAQTWRGDTARTLKAHLRGML